MHVDTLPSVHVVAETPGWFAVLRSEEAVPRHVTFVRLFDEEIAVWRDDAGHINAWENRCPHRGMRLTLGTNTGSELKCRYHGWRFASGTGSCSFIPAHPEQVPPKAAVTVTHRSAERYGFLWIAHGDGPNEPEVRGLDGPALTLRSVTIHAPFRDVAGALSLELPGIPAHFFLQPQGPHVTTVHGLAEVEHSGTARLTFLREQNERLKTLRRQLEAGTAP